MQVEELIDALYKYGRHADDCNLNKQSGWDEAMLALAELPPEARDGSEHFAAHEIAQKRSRCDCGFKEFLKRVALERSGIGR